jgi:sodium/pantothenate symporter
MYVAGIITFFVVIVLIGMMVSRRVSTTEDYYVAGRNAPTMLITGSLVASLLSAVAFTGEAGFSYDGYPMILIIFAVFLSCGYILGAMFFGIYLRRSNVLTLPEFFGERFKSKKVRKAAALTVVIALSGYLIAVTQGSAILLSEVLNVDYITAIVIMWIVYTSFTFLSGAKGVLITDTIMFFVFFIATAISIPFIFLKNGGWPDAFINITKINPDILSWHGITGEGAYMGTPVDAIVWAVILGISWAFVTAVSPWQTSRYLMAKNEHVVIRSGMLAPIPVILIYFLLATTMATVPLINANIEPSEKVYIWLALNILPPIIGIIVLSGIMAAAISSCSTFLQLIGNSVAKDIFFTKKSTFSDEKMLKISRISMFFAAVVVLIATIFPPPAVMFIAYAAGTLFAASWGPVSIASIFSKRITKGAAFWSILVGLFIVLFGEIVTELGFLKLPVYLEPVIIGSVLSTMTLFIVSRFGTVTWEEKDFQNRLLQNPESNYNSKDMTITKKYPILLICSGVALIGFVFIFYFVPVKLL